MIAMTRDSGSKIDFLFLTPRMERALLARTSRRNGKLMPIGHRRRRRSLQSGDERPSAPFAPSASAPSPLWRPDFDFQDHFCHSAPMEAHAFGFRLRANAQEGQKQFPIA
jgi:hypothetical protein